MGKIALFIHPSSRLAIGSYLGRTARFRVFGG